MASQNQSYRVGEAKGQAEEKAQQTGSYVSEKAGQSAKEKSGGLMQRTGEQVRSMAQGAADKVKDSFGMAGSGEDEEEEGGNTVAAATTTRTTS